MASPLTFLADKSLEEVKRALHEFRYLNYYYKVKFDEDIIDYAVINDRLDVLTLVTDRTSSYFSTRSINHIHDADVMLLIFKHDSLKIFKYMIDSFSQYYYFGAGDRWKVNAYYLAITHNSNKILDHLLNNCIITPKISPYLLFAADGNDNVDILKKLWPHLNIQEIYGRKTKYAFKSYAVCYYLIKKGFNWERYRDRFNKSNKYKMFVEVARDIEIAKILYLTGINIDITNNILAYMNIKG